MRAPASARALSEATTPSGPGSFVGHVRGLPGIIAEAVPEVGASLCGFTIERRNSATNRYR